MRTLLFGLTAERWARGLTAFLDFLALAALALTDEVRLLVFLVPALVLVVQLAFRLTLSVRALALLFLPVFGGAVYFWLGLRNPAIVAVAHTVPLVHALLWLAPRNATYRGWRIGVGFVELIVSSGLTADAYLPTLISIFVVVTSVALSCDFMDRELARRSPGERGRILGGSFIRNSAGISVLIFLTAALIFPILPRPRGALNFSQSLTAGYTESVNVKQWAKMDQSSAGSVQLRFYPPPGVDLTEEIYLGLIRSRILDSFDGNQWYPATFRERGGTPHLPESSRQRVIRVEAIREPMASEAYPVPYGTRSVFREGPGGGLYAQSRTQVGEWMRPELMNQRTQYTIELAPNDLTGQRLDLEVDRPRDLHRLVPDSVRTDRLERLAQNIFGRARTPHEKVLRLREFFYKEGFTTQEDPDSDHEVVERQLKRQLMRLKLNPLEEFLLARKQGHCEWFSTASAVLLRLGGVPTRLVAGFRLSSAQLGGVLTVRSSDAHAWVEVYYPDRGWIPFDPTPRASSGFGIRERLRAFSDLLGAYWFKYVVAYGDSTQERGSKDPREWFHDFVQKSSKSSALGRELGNIWIMGLVGALAVVGAFIVLMRPRKRNQGPRSLYVERRRLGRILKIQDPDLTEPFRGFSEAAQPHLNRWREIYLRARFGGGTESLDPVARELRKLSSEIARAMRH